MPPAIRVKTSSGWQDIAIQGATGPQGVKGDPGPTGSQGVPGAFSPYQIGQTWGIGGVLYSGMVIPQIFVPERAGQSVSIVGARAILNTGGTATVQFQRNGSNIGSATVVSTTAGFIALPTTALNDGDRLGLSITAISGTPADLSYTVILEHVGV